MERREIRRIRIGATALALGIAAAGVAGDVKIVATPKPRSRAIRRVSVAFA